MKLQIYHHVFLSMINGGSWIISSVNYGLADENNLNMPVQFFL